jgi:hypothetical protein
MPASPKAYYRALSNIYRRNTHNLTPEHIIQNYPNHLENRLIVAQLTFSGLTPTQIYSLLPLAIMTLSASAGFIAKAASAG